jgi:putative ABC transport system permease protein
LIAGVIGALALTRLFQGLLFETSPTDPVTMVWVGSVLLLVALIACYLPARRAARVDAMIALRYE